MFWHPRNTEEWSAFFKTPALTTHCKCQAEDLVKFTRNCWCLYDSSDQCSCKQHCCVVGQFLERFLTLKIPRHRALPIHKDIYLRNKPNPGDSNQNFWMPYHSITLLSEQMPGITNNWNWRNKSIEWNINIHRLDSNSGPSHIVMTSFINCKYSRTPTKSRNHKLRKNTVLIKLMSNSRPDIDFQKAM